MVCEVFCIYNVNESRVILRLSANIRRIRNRGIAMKFQIINVQTLEIAAICESEQNAQELVQQKQTETGIKHFAKRAPDLDWRKREMARFLLGEYTPCLFADETWFVNRQSSLLQHYPHKSAERADFVAFTESPEKGEQDRQTRVKVGVYLTRFFSDVLTPNEIQHWSRLANMSAESAEIQFAKTTDEIVDVYLNGPDSCMSENVGHYSSDIHPVSVYGDSDLQLAYIRKPSAYHENAIACRALVWPEKMVYGRVYPTPERYNGEARDIARAEQESLILNLERIGYRSGSFNGAKIRAICDSDDSYVMPYLDGGYNLTQSGAWFVFDKNGTITANNTNGLTDLSGMICERCEDSVHEDYTQTVYVGTNGYHQTWCEHCSGNHAFHCEGYGEAFCDDMESVSIGHETYSLRWAERHFVQCEHTDEWFHDSSELDTVVIINGREESWCESARDENDLFYCEGTGKYYLSAHHESIEIDGEIYWRDFAESDSVLLAKMNERETENVGE